MKSMQPSPSRLSDDQLDAEVRRLAACERAATADLIVHLAEFDARRLHLARGLSSLFAYCTGELRLSEHEAYNRIEAARAARRFPSIFERLRDGSVNLTSIRLLSPHLTLENHEGLLAAATHRSRREVEELLAERFPRLSVPASIRRLPDVGTRTAARPALTAPELPPVAPSSSEPLAPSQPSPASPPALPSPAPQPSPAKLMPENRRDAVAPLAPDRYKVTFTATAETCRKLRRVQDLLRQQIPDGNPAEIFDRALSSLLAELERKRLARTERPRSTPMPNPASRHIPAAVRRTVWIRDAGRCAFVAKDGRRCATRAFLEFHHARPYAAGGEASVANIALRCRPHNGYEATLYYGPLRSFSDASPFIVDERSATRSGTSSAAGTSSAGGTSSSAGACSSADTRAPCAT